MFDTPETQEHAGIVIAIFGALTVIPHLFPFDLTGVGWSITIAVAGLIIRTNAQTLRLNRQLLNQNRQLRRQQEEKQE